jgi:bifunctional UDP-N-acetylglucosamine pyrophosphorylase/glucosamine-1-phosphate N-acetyltransferase
MSKPLHIVILAAGEGTRMKSRLPKVLQPLGGRPMLKHLLDSALALQPERIHVVVGSGAEAVREACCEYPVNWVSQECRLGTGHAVMQAMPDVPDGAAVLVLLGDHPLIPFAVLENMAAERDRPLALLTMEPCDPDGYGRITRDSAGNITGVVEHHEAEPEQLRIQEVNTGIIIADAARLRHWLDRLGCDNAKREYYLPDVIPMARAENGEIHGVQADDAGDLQGANDRAQLAELERRYQYKTALALMDAGVHLADPARLDVRGKVEAGRDVMLDVNVVLEGTVVLGDGVRIGPGCTLQESQLADGTQVLAPSVREGVVTTGSCDIVPFAWARTARRVICHTWGTRSWAAMSTSAPARSPATTMAPTSTRP